MVSRVTVWCRLAAVAVNHAVDADESSLIAYRRRLSTVAIIQTLDTSTCCWIANLITTIGIIITADTCQCNTVADRIAWAVDIIETADAGLSARIADRRRAATVIVIDAADAALGVGIADRCGTAAVAVSRTPNTCLALNIACRFTRRIAERIVRAFDTHLRRDVTRGCCDITMTIIRTDNASINGDVARGRCATATVAIIGALDAEISDTGRGLAIAITIETTLDTTIIHAEVETRCSRCATIVIASTFEACAVDTELIGAE